MFEIPKDQNQMKDNKKKSPFKQSQEESKDDDNFDLYPNKNKIKPKILSNEFIDKKIAIDEDLLEEDDEDEKLEPMTPLSGSFIFINKENLGEGSSRSKEICIHFSLK